MKIAIVNHCTQEMLLGPDGRPAPLVTDALLQLFTEVCNKYADIVAEEHDIFSVLRLAEDGMLLPGEFELGLWDSTDQAGAAGYHDTDPQGRPYAKAFRNEADDFGASEWSLTAIATHELAEIMRDPFACWWIDRGTYEEALELCDRVEGYSFGLQFGGAEVQCADFLTAAALDPKAPTGPWDYMNKLSSQTGISPDGYAIVRTASYESNRGAFDKPDVRSGKSFRRRNWKTKTAIGRTGKRLGMQAGIERRCPVCQTPLANPKHMVAPCSVPVTPKPTTEPNTK